MKNIKYYNISVDDKYKKLVKIFEIFEREAMSWFLMNKKKEGEKRSTEIKRQFLRAVSNWAFNEYLDDDVGYVHTWYLSFFLHSHILSHENFTLGKCVNLRQICPETKQLSVELNSVECKTTHRMYHYAYIYPSDVKLHAKGEIKHQV